MKLIKHSTPERYYRRHADRDHMSLTELAVILLACLAVWLIVVGVILK